MAQNEEVDIDTGPGLEAAHSCEYCEANAHPAKALPNGHVVQSIAAPKLANGSAAGCTRSDGNDCDPFSKPSTGNSASTTHVQTLAHLRPENRPPSLTGMDGAANLEERLYSGFQASSTEPWDKEADELEGGSPLSNAPSRAETMEEIDERLRAEKRAKRAERAAQISSLATLSLLLIAATLFLVLAYTGWNAIAAAVALFCASIAGYPFLHLLFYGLSSQMFMKTWGRMSPVDRFKWGQKGASLVHSGLMAAVGLSIVLQGSWNVPDLMTQKDDRVAAFIGLELGYLIQDTGMEAYKHFAFGRSSSALHWVHHLTLLGGLPWYYKYQKGDFFLGALFLWSTSTVPLHLRWFQVQSGMDKGVLYQLNNAALLLSFLACRIVSIPVLLHLYGCTQGWTFQEVPYRIHWSVTAICGSVMLSNSLWLAHLLKNAFKPRRRRRKTSQSSAVEVAGKKVQ